jgi:hypothetical protein
MAIFIIHFVGQGLHGSKTLTGLAVVSKGDLAETFKRHLIEAGSRHTERIERGFCMPAFLATKSRAFCSATSLPPSDLRRPSADRPLVVYLSESPERSRIHGSQGLTGDGKLVQIKTCRLPVCKFERVGTGPDDEDFALSVHVGVLTVDAAP